VKPRVIATIYYNNDRQGSRQQTGSFDPGEFAKLMQDFRRSHEVPTMRAIPYSYVICISDNPARYEELRLFFDEVERIERND
jgi:hypothetical protein